MKNKLPNINSNNGRFINGNPATGTLGTIVTAEWLNGVQERVQDVFEELRNVLLLGNMQPDEQKQNQVAEAIKAYCNNINLKVQSNTRNFENYIPNSKKSNAIDSNSTDTVATSFAAKTAYDKGVEAKTAVNNLDRIAYKVNKSAGYAGNATALMQENTVFSTTAANLLGLPPTAYKFGAGVSMSTDGGKAVIYVAHAGSQVWAKGGYGEDYSQEWKRLDGADWTDVRGRPSSVTHYGFLDFDITDVMEADLNHITKPGLYGQRASAGATLNRNYPIQEAGTLLVTPSAYGVMQEYTTFYHGYKYVRNRGDSNSWLPWKRVDALDKLSLADFTQHFGSNGWCRLPNGLILQWGEFANCYTDSDRLLHFPITFPTACWYVGEGKVMSPRTSTIERVQITDYSASGFYASTAQVGRGFIAQDTLTFSYFAIGY